MVEFQALVKHNLEFNLQIMFRSHMITVELETEGSFMVERALQIAEACGADMEEYSCLYRKGSQACERKMLQPKDFLENIFFFHVCSYTLRWLSLIVSHLTFVKILMTWLLEQEYLVEWP